ncbi:IpaD/SipD/SspD family type III secretion system needle tip protein [Escherichia albertii]
MSNETIHFEHIVNIPKTDSLLQKEDKKSLPNTTTAFEKHQRMSSMQDIKVEHARSIITPEIEKLLQELNGSRNLLNKLDIKLKMSLPELSLQFDGAQFHLSNSAVNVSLTPEQKGLITTINQQLKFIFESIKSLEKILENSFSRQLTNNSLLNILSGLNNDIFSESGKQVIKSCFLSILTKLNSLTETKNLSHAEKFVVQQCINKINQISMNTYAPDSSVSGSNDVSTNSNSSMISDMQLCNEIADLMTILDTDYLGIYEYAVSAMTRYWKDFSNQIQGNLANWTHADKEDIYFNVDEFQKALKNFYSCTWDQKNQTYVYHYCHDYILYPPQPTPPPETPIGVPLDEAMKWCSAFGLQPIPQNNTKPTYSPIIEEPPGSGLYIIIPDPKIIMQLSNSADALKYDNKNKAKKPDKDNHGYKISTAEYQAWQTAFNTEIENMKTDVQILTSRYSTANSTYDLVIKLLSSTITALFDSAKGYLNF